LVAEPSQKKPRQYLPPIKAEAGKGFVTGLDFSRAELASKCAWALAPAGCFSLFATYYGHASPRFKGKQPTIKNIRVIAPALTDSRQTAHPLH
jgi:hypothetical protein